MMSHRLWTQSESQLSRKSTAKNFDESHIPPRFAYHIKSNYDLDTTAHATLWASDCPMGRRRLHWRPKELGGNSIILTRKVDALRDRLWWFYLGRDLGYEFEKYVLSIDNAFPHINYRHSDASLPRRL